MIYPILLTWKPVAVKNAVCGPFADMFACIYGIFAKIEYYVSNKSLFRVKNIQNKRAARTRRGKDDGDALQPSNSGVER